MTLSPLTQFDFDVDADGIATLTWDMPGKAMNVITDVTMAELSDVIDHVSEDTTLKGCVIISGKPDSFSGGADIKMIQGLLKTYHEQVPARGEAAAMQSFFDESRRLTLLLRKLETCGKPFVAAINGVCLGGAFELALACHHRLVSDDAKTRVGLPEIKIGIFPGAGGTQRVARLAPTGDALLMMMKGDQLKPDAAKAINLVHAIVSKRDLLARAKAVLREGINAVQPWDQEGFRPPSGKVYSPQGMTVWPAASAICRRETFDNYPAAKALLQSVYEGLQLPMDLGLRVESRYFAHILQTPEAAAMIRTLFISMQELNKGARRPARIPASAPKRVGIIGAGFMGAGIAYVSALAGIEVILIDRDQASADKGKAHADKVISGLIAKNRALPEVRDALLGLITPTADYAQLKTCDLVIEAVFEDPSVKDEAIRKAEAAMDPSTIFASNTSTLPIGGLAKSFSRQADFIGIHFFSPVDRMQLVEIITTKQTGEPALATAFDFVRAIKKTPIVVNDARGFFANRCVLNYLLEGHLMLDEGVPPAMIENAARMAGMPVGPLSLTDEVAIDLCYKILKATKAQLGPDAVNPVQDAMLETLVEQQGRLGRKNGKGFYDYPEKGPKTLWPGLSAFQKTRLDPDTIDVTVLKQRFLATQALEAARSVEENIITDPREADVGAILGFGFAPFTGGPLSMIDGMGAKAFVALCDDLARRFGKRFEPNAALRAMAASGGRFYKG